MCQPRCGLPFHLSRAANEPSVEAPSTTICSQSSKPDCDANVLSSVRESPVALFRLTVTMVSFTATILVNRPVPGKRKQNRSGNDAAENWNPPQNRHDRKARGETGGGTEDDVEDDWTGNDGENPDEREVDEVDAERAFRDL